MRRSLLAVAALLLAGCNPLTQDNYQQLKPGMPRAEVEQLLGSPLECSGALGMSSYRWGDEQRYISVQYAADKVVLFSARGLK